MSVPKARCDTYSLSGEYIFDFENALSVLTLPDVGDIMNVLHGQVKSHIKEKEMERWYWIELIGFDNELPDYGTDAFLSRNVTTSGVSLLFSHLDFLFTDEGEPLPANACSYAAHEYNRERRRQVWTLSQVRGLVDALKARGVKVFLSCFDMVGSIPEREWLAYGRRGTPESHINPVKRIGDGYVIDGLLDRICRIIELCGFDGLHLADGLSSSRRSIECGDFSLPICRDSRINIPAELMRDGCDAYIKRREWILAHERVAWTRFIAERWAMLYDRVFARVKLPIIFNNAWTRDSFEALYRYGLDYRRCHTDEAYAVMIEENSATRAITAPEDEGGVIFPLSHRDGFTYEYALMQQNIRLATNGLRQISLTPISDTLEQWDALRHCPTELMRSIVRRYNNFVYRNGGFEVCSDAPMYCLSDGIPASDWEWLASVEGYRIPLPERVCGFAAVCNPDALEREVEHFCRERHYFGSALLRSLVLGGMNLGAQISLTDAPSFDGASALVVTDLNAYTEEQKRMLAKTELPVIAIGEDVELPLRCSCRYNGDYISVALYNTDGTPPELKSLKGLDNAIEPTAAMHGEIWTEELSYKRVDERFFVEVSRILNTYFGADVCLDRKIKVHSFESSGDKYVIISNDDYIYNICTVSTPSKIKSAISLTKGRGYEVKIDGGSFTVRIPPRCIELVRVKE